MATRAPRNPFALTLSKGPPPLSHPPTTIPAPPNPFALSLSKGPSTTSSHAHPSSPRSRDPHPLRSAAP